MLNYRFYIPRPDRFLRGLRARSRRPVIDNATAQEILAKYSFAVVRSLELPDDRGRGSSLIVDTSDGKIFLKQYVSSTTLPMIIHEHSILRYLAQTNFPAPRLIYTDAGETVVNMGNKNYALFEFIAGGFHYHHYLWLPPQSRRFIALAGEALAHLHCQLENFSPEGQNPNGFRSRAEGRWRDLDWYLSLLANCVQVTSHMKAANASRANYLLGQASRLEQTMVDLDRMLKTANLPRRIIHSDYGPYNLLFRSNLAVTVLDFEIARLDWRLSEFVYALPGFAHNKWLGFIFNKAKYFLDAYRAHLTISDDELRFLPAVWQYLKTRQAIRNWHAYNETSKASRLIKAVNDLKWAMWATEKHEVLVNTLAAA